MAGKKGRSGRPRKSTELKVIQGTFRPDRESSAAVQLPPGRPKIREGLSPATMAEIEWIIEDLETLGVLSEVDGRAIELCGQSLATYWKNIEFCEQEGYTYSNETDKGYLQTGKRPEAAVAETALKNAKDLLMQFGLTLASRPKIPDIDKKKQKPNKFEKIGKNG